VTIKHSDRGCSALRNGYLVTVTRMEVARSLPLSARAPRSARGLLDDLGAELPTSVLDGARLVASELVTNAVKHSGLAEGTPIQVRIAVDPRRVRIEVCDQGRGFKRRPPDREAPPSGWGLQLVRKISDRWGIHGNHRTVAWAEFDLSA
jgi:anti-sigma regulatory factor (Ser/Thr protein kinase)